MTTTNFNAPQSVEQPDGWSVQDAADLYQLDAWSDGFFVLDEAGHIAVRPFDSDPLTISLPAVIAEARQRNIRTPLLLRFQDILHTRVKRLNKAFESAIARIGYDNVYRSVYPIKVNQLHEVVEEVLDAGKPFGLGLECGSKPELIAMLAHLDDDERLLLCNGVKDSSMLSLIVSAQVLGKTVIPIMEKYVEFKELMAIGQEHEVTPKFGVRVRLRTAGAGKWADSGGYRSKFGISLPELIEVVETLESGDARESLTLLHFHLGSQISEIHQLQAAAREMSHIYAELWLRGIPVRYLDVGGGVGVNYTGDFDEGSIHYSLQEYANAVVSTVHEVCTARKVPEPVLVSESGRAMTAHHSVLIVEALGAFRKDRAEPGIELPADASRLLHELAESLQWLRSDASAGASLPRILEAYHRIEARHEDASARFGMGYLTLQENAIVEQLYWSGCAAVLRRLRETDPEPMPPEMLALEEKLVDQYLCNFSVFQSMLDHWAIEQPFPIMPVSRLDEQPSRQAMLVDLTCDSDGKISRYVSSNSNKGALPLHPITEGEPYYLAVFLMGAYQDIMGDSHNLFGRVAEVHVYADPEEENNFWFEKSIPGTVVKDILAQVQYFPNDLRRRMQDIIKQKIDAGVVRPKRGMQILDEYMACFDAHTYADAKAKAGPEE